MFLVQNKIWKISRRSSMLPSFLKKLTVATLQHLCENEQISFPKELFSSEDIEYLQVALYFASRFWF